MTFGDYVRLMRTYWRSVVLVTAVGIGAALGVSFAMTPQYTASAQVLFTPVSSTASGQDLAFTAQYVQARMVVYQGLVGTPRVLGIVVSTLNLGLTPGELAKHVSAEFPPGSTLLTIKVEDPVASQAAKTAEAVSQSLISVVTQSEIQKDASGKADASGAPRVTGTTVADPTEPTSPSSPNFQLNIAAGALLGLILGLAQAATRFVRNGLPAQQQPREPRLPFARTAPVVSPSVAPPTPVAAQPPLAPRSTKPPSQKRPGKRTRR